MPLLASNDTPKSQLRDSFALVSPSHKVSMLKEFKEFIAKGNMLDLAIGVVLGAAFGAVINSLVSDLINPIIGLMGGANFDNMFLVLKEGTTAGPYLDPETAQKAGAVTLNYGKFFTAILKFLVVGFALFMVVKAANRMRQKQEAEPEAAPADVALLAEIRDLLKNRS